MTFDADVSATWGGALADLRDNVGGLASWTVKDDSSGGAGALTSGDFIVLTSNTPAEDIKLECEAQGQVSVEHGPDWNASTDSWDDQFTYDPNSTGLFYGGGSGSGQLITGFSSPGQLYPKDRNPDDDPLLYGATGSYWMEYTDSNGFGMFWQREEADSYDGSTFIGMALINEAWNYTNADNREAQWVLGLASSYQNNQRLIHLSESGRLNQDSEKIPEVSSDSYEARGLVNPDTNFNNYPITNNVVASTQYTNIEGNSAIIGDFNTWTGDQSGNETGHRDLIQDSGSNNVYTVLKRDTTPDLLLRMD